MNIAANPHVYSRTVERMGTLVRMQVAGRRDMEHPASENKDILNAVDRAFDWFRRVEESCTRFDPRSELSQISQTVDQAVPASDILYQALHFALAVAEQTNGALDPTVGALMESRGFNREYRSGAAVRLAPAPAGSASFRDVRLDPANRTVTLLRPLLLDLGAVAKGLAIDLAARELAPFHDFGIDAGGDLYLGGHNPDGAPWSVGIRHPRHNDALLDSIRVSDRAVCTSGDYERRLQNDGGRSSDHHLLDPRNGQSALGAASVTVVAPTAMLADALATAAFVLGPAEGLALFERHAVEGLIVSSSLERHMTRGFLAGAGAS